MQAAAWSAEDHPARRRAAERSTPGLADGVDGVLRPVIPVAVVAAIGRFIFPVVLPTTIVVVLAAQRAVAVVSSTIVSTSMVLTTVVLAAMIAVTTAVVVGVGGGS